MQLNDTYWSRSPDQVSHRMSPLDRVSSQSLYLPGSRILLDTALGPDSCHSHKKIQLDSPNMRLREDPS